MFIFRALLICLLACSAAHAEIRQTTDLNIVKQEIFASPKDTLVVFDVDFVLTTPGDEVFILSVTDDGRKLLSGIYDDLWARLPKHEIDEMQSVMMLTQPWRPITPDTAKIFNQIKNNGYKVLGLTASGTGAFGRMRSMEKWRVEELQSIGITFDKNFINAKPGSLDAYIPRASEHYSKTKHACFPAADKGIVFTCMIPKGETLDAYLQFANIKPKKIIFIDDIINNLETVEDFCKKFNIQYIGYEYTAIREQAKQLKLNPRRSKLQYKVLELTKTWLNDTQADIVLATIDK